MKQNKIKDVPNELITTRVSNVADNMAVIEAYANNLISDL